MKILLMNLVPPVIAMVVAATLLSVHSSCRTMTQEEATQQYIETYILGPHGLPADPGETPPEAELFSRR